MLKGFIVSAVVAGQICAAAYACDMQGKTGIVAENNLYIPVDAKSISTITIEKFNSILDRVEALYAPVLKARGKTLIIERNWTDGTVNAYAEQNGNDWSISMFGGLARHSTITEDGFALVACHELGHHIGGAPKIAGDPDEWASNEGQADYFGNSKCLRNYMKDDDNAAIVARMTVDALVQKKCEANFHNENDIAICIRGAMAGMSLGNLFKVLARSTKPLSFSTPDRTVVTRTDDNHPASQCRLDTYFAGAICEKDFNLPVSETDVNVGYCTTRDGYTDGVRPRCWFKP